MRSLQPCAVLACLLWTCLLPASALPATGQDAAAGSLAVRAGTLYPVSSPAIENGVVVVEDGKITAVGPASEVEIPEGLQTLEAAVVVPGFVDPHSVVGLAGHLNTSADQDQLEGSVPLQPELRALDAYDARERLVRWVRGFGVTTLHTGHGPGAVISGQTLVVKTRGDTVEEAVVVPSAMVAATVGESAQGEDGEKTKPGTRAKVVALLREAFYEARAYQEKRQKAPEDKRPGLDLRHETLLRVLGGELPLLVTADRHQDISSALRLQQEFGFRLVLDSATEAYLLLDEIRAAGVPVLLHPTMARPRGERENLSMGTAAQLAAAGIPFALQTGFESYVPKTRVLVFEAAIAAAQGLGFDAALEAITLSPARILGLEDRVGSLEVGKDGDLALFDGDPFEYTTHCVGTVIEGLLVSEGERTGEDP